MARGKRRRSCGNSSFVTASTDQVTGLRYLQALQKATGRPTAGLQVRGLEAQGWQPHPVATALKNQCL